MNPFPDYSSAETTQTSCSGPRVRLQGTVNIMNDAVKGKTAFVELAYKGPEMVPGACF